MTIIAPLNISIFRDCRARKPLVSTTVDQVINDIRRGAYLYGISQIRQTDDADKRRLLKAALKAVTFAGEFATRNNNGCTSLSGLTTMDFDHLEDPEAVKAALTASEHCYAAFLSPSGDGVKALFLNETPATNELTPVQAQSWYGQAWEASAALAKQLTGVEPDPAPKALASLCFVSHDPTAHFNSSATPLPTPTQPEPETQPKPNGTTTSWRNGPSQDYHEWRSQVSNLINRGFSYEAIDTWSRKGAKYQEGEIRQFQNWFDERTAKGYGTTNNAVPTDPQQRMPASNRPWLTIGHAAALQLGSDAYAYDSTADGGRGWFYRRINQHWQLVPKQASHILIDQVHLQADGVESHFNGNDDLRALFRSHFKGQRTELSSDFWTGLRNGLRRDFVDLPQDFIPLNNGLLDLTKVYPELTEHSPTLPYRVTAVATGNFRADLARSDALNIVRQALNPAMPNAADQDKLLWALAQALGGRAGGAARGSVIALVGEGGSGKGWIIRYAQAAFGQLSVAASQGSLAPRFESEINAGLAEIVERNARLVTLGEANNLRDLRHINMLTGGDTITTRKPYGALVTGAVHAALIYAAPTIPPGNIISGLWRRIMPIFLPGNVANRDPKACKDEATPAEVDALTTYLCHLAHDLAGGGQPKELWTTPASLPKYAATADPLIDWLDTLPTSYAGTEIATAYAEFLRDRPLARDQYQTQRGFSRACNSNEVMNATGWYVKKSRKDGRNVNRLTR